MSDDAMDRRKEPWWIKGIIPVIITGFVVGLIAWGETRQSVAEHARKIDRLESLSEVVIDLRAQVRFLVDAEQRRQRRGGE